jgi:putative phosphoesterase
MRYGVIADTHGALHSGIPDLFEGVAEIFHAGDVGSERVLDELAAVAPVIAVQGNMDGSPALSRLPERLVLEREGRRIVLLHGHLLRAARPALLLEATREARPDLVIFGHTHEALKTELDGVVFFNPGAAGRPRFRAKPTVGFLEIDSAGLRVAHRELSLPWPVPF